MSEHVDFERLVAGHIADEGAAPPSDAFYDELITRAGGSGQRPEWLALIKEPPMRTNSRVAVGSPTVRVMAILAATLLLALALAAAGAGVQRLLAADGPIVVAQDGSGHFATVQEAVTAARDGDEILIKPGTYQGGIDIDKDIVIRGEDRGGVIVEAGIGCSVPDNPFSTIDCPGDPRRYTDTWLSARPYAFLLDGTEAELSDLTMELGVAHGVIARGGAPIVVTVNGCTYGGSAIRHDVVAGRGLFLEFGNNVLTTRIRSFDVFRGSDPGASGESHLPC